MLEPVDVLVGLVSVLDVCIVAVGDFFLFGAGNVSESVVRRVGMRDVRCCLVD